MCLHPKIDLDNSLIRDVPNRDIDDDCDYVYYVKNVEDEDLTIIQLNIHGILSKRSLLLDLIETSVENGTPDIVIISETWLTPTSPTISVPGYKFIHKCREHKKGGGVGILVSDNLRSCELPSITSNLVDNEVVTVEVSLKSGKRCIICSMYRAPNTTPQVFQCCYNSLVCAMKKKKPYAIIVGLDHNMDLLKTAQHKSTNEFMQNNLDMGLFPTITKPTRITKSSATLIDNIIVSENLCGKYSSNILINDMSDHMPTICVLESMKASKKDKKVITSRDIRPKNIAALKSHLSSYNWTELLNSDSLDANFDTFGEILQLELDRCTPVNTRTVSHRALRKEPWVTPSLKRCIEKNKRLYCKTLKNTTNQVEVVNYQEYNKHLKRALRLAKRMYHYDKCEEYKNNTKKLWKVVNEIVGKSNDKSGTVDYLCIDGIKEYGAKKIANQFAKYFSNVGKNFANKIPKPKNSIDLYLKKLQSNHKSLFFEPCTEQEIMKLINSLPLKSSHGHDNISNVMLRTIVNEISHPLSLLINQSLLQGIFPTSMKLAEVVPLFKSKDRYMETNYRPISLLTTMSKVLEKVVYARVYKFLTKTEQISETQYGFRAKHSCEHAVGQLIGTILKNLENNKTTISVLLDLSKAFDTIEHSIMLEKLELYGVRGLPLQWFKSYLSDRVMRVKCRTACSSGVAISENFPIEFGTPQGSCLGPLIFLIFVNDMSLHVSDVELVQFADDTTLIFGHRNHHYLKYCIERELEHLQDWFYANKLTLNVDKSVYMLFEKNNTTCDIRISVCNQEIPRCTSAKFLGTWLDDKLNWKTHVSKLLSKLKCGLGMMRRSNKFLTANAKRTLYFGQVHSNLSYGISIWGPMLKRGQLHDIFAVQQKCVNLIGGNRPFVKYKIPTVFELVKLEQCKLGYKLCKGLLPAGLRKVMLSDHKSCSTTKTHPYATRSKNIPNRPSAKLNLYRNSFLYSSIQYYSNLSADVRDSPNITIFVKKCKKALLST